MNPNRTIVYIKDFLDKKKGETETVDRDIALNLIKQGWADIKEKKKPKKLDTTDDIKTKNFAWLSQQKKDKRYIVQSVIWPKTVNMLYAPPREFKTTIALLLGLCVSTGRPFLGLPTKKSPVLFLEKENGLNLIRETSLGLRKGLKIRTKQMPLRFLIGDGDLDSTEWVERLKNTIRQREIKLVIFDTLHRFALYEENKADDINRLFLETLHPIAQNCDCAILFLHHATKEGVYRGSSDFLGMVHTAWRLKRAGLSKKVVLHNEKNRWGEIEKIEAEISFNEEHISVRVIPASETDAEAIGRISYLKECTEEIKKLFSIVGSILKRSEVLDHFEILRNSTPPRDYSIRTIDRSLKWLCLNKFLEKTEKKQYRRVLLANDENLRVQ